MKIRNSDVTGAKTALVELLKMKFPIKTSMEIAKLDVKLNEPVDVFVKARDGLFAAYDIKREVEDGQIRFTSDKEGDLREFTDKFNELFREEVEVDFKKVKLPEKVASTCEKCHHNMDKLLEIEPSLLVALDKFVEV